MKSVLISLRYNENDHRNKQMFINIKVYTISILTCFFSVTIIFETLEGVLDLFWTSRGGCGDAGKPPSTGEDFDGLPGGVDGVPDHDIQRDRYPSI